MIALILRLLLNIIAAQQAATPHVSARLLLAVAAVESDFDPTTVSHVPTSHAWGFCGVCQTIAMSEQECFDQRSLRVGYQLAVKELSWWLKRCRGDVVCMLLGHGCGGPGISSGVCGEPDRNGDRYPARVLRIERLLSTNKRTEGST